MPAPHEEKIRLKLVIDPGDVERRAVEASKRANERARREGRTPRAPASDEGAKESRSRRSRLSDEERDARAAATARRQFLHAQAGLANAVFRLGSITRALHNPLHALLELNRISHSLRVLGVASSASRPSQIAAQASQVTREVSRQLSRPLSPLHAQMPQSSSAIARETSRLIRTLDRTAPTVTAEAKRRGLTSLAPILGRLYGDEYERPAGTNSPRPALPPGMTAFRQLPRFKSILQQMNTNLAAGPPPAAPPPLPPAAAGSPGGAGGIGRLIGGLGGGSGAGGALAGGAIALAVVLELRNVAKGLQTAVRGWAQIGGTFATANASGAIHGGLSLYQGAARIGVGPLVGPVADRIIGVGHHLIDALDHLSNNLARFNPITAAGAARLEMQKTLFRFGMAQTFQPIISPWQQLQGTVLDILQKFGQILRPVVNILGKFMDGLARIAKWIDDHIPGSSLMNQTKQMQANFLGGIAAVPQNGRIGRPMPAALPNVFTDAFGTGNRQQRFAEIDSLDNLIQSTREAIKGETDPRKRSGYYATLQSALIKESRLIASLGGSFVLSDRAHRLQRLSDIDKEIGFLEFNQKQGEPIDAAKLKDLRTRFSNIAAGMKMSDDQAKAALRRRFGDDAAHDDIGGMVPRPAFNPAPGPPVQVPVPNLDIRQKVELTLNQKISNERMVFDMVQQVHDWIEGGNRIARDEAGLARSIVEGHVYAMGAM